MLVIGVGAVLTAGGGVAYATTADAGSPPARCSAQSGTHLQVIDGSAQACRAVVGGITGGSR